MSTIATKTEWTAADLLAMPDEKNYELVDGVLVERVVGTESSWIGGKVFNLLFTTGQEGGQGWAFPPETGYQCFPQRPGLVRKPDGSFIRVGRLPGERLPRLGYLRVVPDIVVEVISPNELASELERKVRECLDAGTRLVWVVNPETQEVRIHRANRTITGLRADEELTGEDVLPGFRCRVGDLFPPTVADDEPLGYDSQTPVE